MVEALNYEIEATLITEKGVEYYENWASKTYDNREQVQLTVGYDSGWQRASSRRLLTAKVAMLLQ